MARVSLVLRIKFKAHAFSVISHQMDLLNNKGTYLYKNESWGKNSKLF